MTDTTQVFWCRRPGATVPICIDLAVTNEQGHIVGCYNGQTLEQLASRYPAPVLTDISVYREVHDAALRTEPEPSTAEDFQIGLEVVPPVAWRTLGDFEVFAVGEAHSGHMHRFYARVKSTFWTWVDDVNTPVQVLMDRLHVAIAKELKGVTA